MTLLKTYLMSGLALTVATLAATQAQETIALVVGKGTNLENLSTAELQKLFRCEKSKAPDGSKVTIVMRDAGSPEREAVLASVLKMGESEYLKHILLATFTGAVQAAPKALSSGGAVKQFVSSTPGGLGYIKTSELDDTVKVVRIDGKSPTEADYPVKSAK
ncbi:MAG: hypothetical protein HY299_08425 [Verrucomicrobia bacterium]|nr:hypothetical protein [Verrucomicrobiota bacterium]